MFNNSKVRQKHSKKQIKKEGRVDAATRPYNFPSENKEFFAAYKEGLKNMVVTLITPFPAGDTGITPIRALT